MSIGQLCNYHDLTIYEPDPFYEAPQNRTPEMHRKLQKLLHTSKEWTDKVKLHKKIQKLQGLHLWQSRLPTVLFKYGAVPWSGELQTGKYVKNFNPLVLQATCTCIFWTSRM
jgi:hypothetical protein